MLGFVIFWTIFMVIACCSAFSSAKFLYKAHKQIKNGEEISNMKRLQSETFWSSIYLGIIIIALIANIILNWIEYFNN